MAVFSLYEPYKSMAYDLPDPMPEIFLAPNDVQSYAPNTPPPPHIRHVITPVARIALNNAVGRSLIRIAAQGAIQIINQAESRHGVDEDCLYEHSEYIFGRISIDPNRHAIIMASKGYDMATLFEPRASYDGIVVAHMLLPMLTRTGLPTSRPSRLFTASFAVTLRDVLAEKGF